MSSEIDLLRLIDLIYEAAVDPEAWPRAMAAAADALGARATSLEIAEPNSGRTPFVVAPRTDPDWLRAYGERWAAANFVRMRGLAFAVGEAYRFEDVAPRAAFERTPFYNEFWVPQQLNVALFTNAAKSEDVVVGIGFYRSASEGSFDRREERLLKALAPHFQRAAALRIRLARIEMERDSTAELLNRCDQGALLVDREARILYANPAAEAILAEGAALGLRDGRLAACAASMTAALRSMIAGSADGVPGGMLTLPGLDDRPLAVLVVPLPAGTPWLTRSPAAIVFLKEPSRLPSRERIRQQFDLTPAQAALAREILIGDGIQAAAERLGIARSTARTHLLEVFQKTGTNRQAELVRVVLQQILAAPDPSRPSRDQE